MNVRLHVRHCVGVDIACVDPGDMFKVRCTLNQVNYIKVWRYRLELRPFGALNISTWGHCREVCRSVVESRSA